MCSWLLQLFVRVSIPADTIMPSLSHHILEVAFNQINDFLLFGLKCQSASGIYRWSLSKLSIYPHFNGIGSTWLAPCRMKLSISILSSTIWEHFRPGLTSFSSIFSEISLSSRRAFPVKYQISHHWICSTLILETASGSQLIPVIGLLAYVSKVNQRLKQV